MKIEIIKQFNDMKLIIIAGIFILFLAACNQKPSESAEGEAAEPASNQCVINWPTIYRFRGQGRYIIKT